jgi:uncharacterized protein (TIGR00369 family)
VTDVNESSVERPNLPNVESGPEHTFAVARSVLEGEEVVCSMPTGPWLRGPAGFPPGGVLGVLIDDILGFAIILQRPEAFWTVSAEISVDLVGQLPADGTVILARGRSLHTGRHGGFAAGTITDSSGRLLAVCRQHGRWITTMPENPNTPTAPPPAEHTGPVPAESVLAGSERARGRAAGHASTATPLSATPLSATPSPAPGLATLMGAALRATEVGAVLEIKVTPEVANPLGNLHGGFSFAACDLVAQAALHAAGGPTQTASIRVNYPRPFPPGSTARFEARLLHQGRGLGIVSVTGTAGRGKPCVIATVTTGVSD